MISSKKRVRHDDPVFWNKRNRQWSFLRIHAPVTLVTPFTSTQTTQTTQIYANIREKIQTLFFDIFDDTRLSAYGIRLSALG